MTTVVSPSFPAPIVMGGRLKFDRIEVENYKRSLARLPLLERNPAAEVSFVSAKDVCRDLGINRRTLGRRVKEFTH